MRSCLFLFSLTALNAQIGLQPPSFGCHAGPDGKLRSFEGVKASLVASPPMAEGVRRAMCVGRYALYQTGSEVVLLAGDESYRIGASDGSLLGLDDGIAVAADPASGELHYWQDGEWRLSPARVDPSTVSVRLNGTHLSTLYRNRLQTINIVSGEIESDAALPPFEQAAVLLNPQLFITIVDNRWRRCDQAGCLDLGPAAAGITALQPLNREWIAATLSSGTVLAVRVEEAAMDSFYLPGSAHE